MDLSDISWLVAFSVLLMVINFLYIIMVKSLKDKPLGVQTIYDQTLQDSFFIGTVFASWICCAYISTR